MQKDRTKWRANRGARAVKIMSDIQASIEVLGDEDLLDLHDIFTDQLHTPIGDFASAEMRKRELAPETHCTLVLYSPRSQQSRQ